MSPAISPPYLAWRTWPRCRVMDVSCTHLAARARISLEAVSETASESVGGGRWGIGRSRGGSREEASGDVSPVDDDLCRRDRLRARAPLGGGVRKDAPACRKVPRRLREGSSWVDASAKAVRAVHSEAEHLLRARGEVVALQLRDHDAHDGAAWRARGGVRAAAQGQGCRGRGGGQGGVPTACRVCVARAGRRRRDWRGASRGAPPPWCGSHVAAGSATCAMLTPASGREDGIVQCGTR